MRLEVVTGYWRFNSFSSLGKLSQVVESWRCDGSYPGHLALRFVFEGPNDRSILFGLPDDLFANGNRGVCSSILFDITRSRGAKFHTLMQLPWSHASLTNIITYTVSAGIAGISGNKVAICAFDACVKYASGWTPYRYDDCTYLAAFFPACAGSGVRDAGSGHCVQLALQILSAALYGDKTKLQSHMIYSGRCIFGCIEHPSYASYSPQLAVVALKRLGVLEGGVTLTDDECVPFISATLNLVPLRIRR